MNRAAVRWGVIAATWTALALLSFGQNALVLTQRGVHVALASLLLARLADWYTCAAFTPAYFWIVRRWPVDRAHWKTSVPLLFVATSIFVVIKYIVFAAMQAHVLPRPFVTEPTPTWRSMLASNFVYESMIFWAVIGVVHAVEFHRRYRERELHTLQLRAQLTEARLDALGAQLNPHFLFNTLHGVSTLMHRDVDAADTMLARLADLLRRTLDPSVAHEVTLAEELSLLDDYLAIVRVRFGDRLSLESRVSGDVRGALVPRFILQPLVENALEHGIARRAGAGRVEIAAVRENGALRLSVTDDGAGMRGTAAAPAGDGNGIGLSNTRRRLGELYGDEHALVLSDALGGGLRATITLPFRTETASSDGGGT